MIKIGKIYIMRRQGVSRLCADISIGRKRSTLWFAVDRAHEPFLCGNRADAFVMALLPTAIRGRHEIICENFMSERLQYQLNEYLIPALISNRADLKFVQIHAPMVKEKYTNCGAIGTVFSGDAESLYTVMKHGRKCEYPLTHIAVFNIEATSGIRDWYKLKNNCYQAEKLAKEQNLKFICVDTNIYKVFHENMAEVCSFRKIACIFALQGLFSIFLLPAQYDAANFKLDSLNAARYELLTANCASTESLLLYCDGGEANHYEKLKALTEWETSWHWLHSCINKSTGSYNCGHCISCTRDLTIFYKLKRLECYQDVFKIKKFGFLTRILSGIKKIRGFI
ncbi:MAG: hypothetical protein HFG28_11415 [Eubacterium sp.]|nr:hypothetical protein [Eubacterium sp.]